MSNRDGYHAGPGDPDLVDKNPKNASFQSYAKQSAGGRGMSKAREYTPDETELRDCYAASLHEHAGEDYTTAKADAERGIAKIKADALREAMHMFAIGFGSTYPGQTVRDKLNKRAENIEADPHD